MHDVVHFQRADGTPLAVEDCPLHDVGRHGRVVRTADEVFIRKDRRVFPIDVTAAPFIAEDGVRGYVVVFSDASERKAEEGRVRDQMEEVSWLRSVRDALTEDRFVLYAQPIIDLATGDTVQHELLIRMIGPTGEVIAPGRFLPAAEEYGLITDVDRWVIQQAAQLAAQGHAVEINLSAHSLSTARLIDKFEDVLRRTGADPALITIELTETALVQDEQAAATFIERMRGLGCKLALDDFGTGYASFTYLKRLPVDYLKIDREFVVDVIGNPASRHVVNAVVRLARDFGHQTIAEGVEDERTLCALRDLGVDFAQGYAIARPLPVSDVLTLAAVSPRARHTQLLPRQLQGKGRLANPAPNPPLVSPIR
jgi:EAL domain-containing protein (putative c-di-GMP-specific phosphodiesterase class I)